MKKPLEEKQKIGRTPYKYSYHQYHEYYNGPLFYNLEYKGILRIPL
jgi:hypothetical protein